MRSETIISEYIEGKQSLRQLSERHGVCVKTVWNRLSQMSHIHKIASEKSVVILMDTTYWGRNFGLMIIKDAFRNKILWYKFVRNETIADYKEGVEWLKDNGFKIYGIVCDGMRGLFNEFRFYRIQMCQFHMTMIVRRYLTLNPDMEASQELLYISNQISKVNQGEFLGMLDRWGARWDSFIKERSVDKATGKTSYTHMNLRRAYNSLRYYQPYLWTCEKYPEYRIPNTNAGIESLNGKLKTMLRVHSGISKFRRMKLIQEFIARHY